LERHGNGRRQWEGVWETAKGEEASKHC
jgi:hypothetical protein